jgi:A/G-specific adenine glycosylase
MYDVPQEKMATFVAMVLSSYQEKGRVLPWRETLDPYAIMVSEIMLQQTQVDRVIPKYERFLEELPTPFALAKCSTAQLLGLWQGLGYNRRALNLQRAAQAICEDYDGVVPQDEERLRALPGIGPYTAAAIRAFAFDLEGFVIETNIRRVYIQHFFPDEVGVSDKQLTPYISAGAHAATQVGAGPRIWNWALMDYGSLLPKIVGNANQRSASYTKQSKFEGSRRQVRGEIIRRVLDGPQEITVLYGELDRPSEEIDAIIAELVTESFVVIQDQVVHVAERDILAR